MELLLLLALVLLMVYMVQARDTDGDGILDAGKTTDGPTWVEGACTVLHKCSEHQCNGLKDNNMLGIVQN